MFISIKLKKLRKEKNYTLDYVSKITGINKSMLSKYENNISEPSCKNIEKLADFYHIKIDELFFRDINIAKETDENYIIAVPEVFVNILEVFKDENNEEVTKFILEDPKRRLEAIINYYFRNH